MTDEKVQVLLTALQTYKESLEECLADPNAEHAGFLKELRLVVELIEEFE